MYRGKANGKKAYVLRQTVLNNSNLTPNIRESPYTGFLMFSRRYCSLDFTDKLAAGEISLSIYDFESTYAMAWNKYKKTCLNLEKSLLRRLSATFVGKLDF